VASIFFALALLFGASAPCWAALTQHWKLDDNAASTTVVATAGTNGTLNGGDNTSAKTVGGPGGSITAGFDFNGTDDAVDISAASVSFASGTAFSVSFWAEWDASTDSALGNTSNASVSRIYKSSDTTITISDNAGSSTNFTVPSLGTSAWCHVLVARTGSSMRVFVNGVESSSGAQTRTGIFAPNRIGQRGGSTFHDGKLAQVKIFNSDESANVATLYAEGTGGGGSGAAVHYYQQQSAVDRDRQQIYAALGLMLPEATASLTSGPIVRSAGQFSIAP
jgi:hypothetical protein